MRLLPNGHSLYIPLYWMSRHSSTLASRSSHITNSGFLPSQEQQQNTFSSISSSLSSSDTTKRLRCNRSEVAIIPISASQTRGCGIRSCDSSEGMEKKEERRLNKVLKNCIKTPCIKMYENLLVSSTELYKASPSHHWSLHSLVLVNYGVQCLVDQKITKAIEYLRQAIEIIFSFEGETPVLHLRIILANALACEGHCFDALCEYERTLSVMRDYPVESSLNQIVSGKESHIPLSRSYVSEDFDRFLANEKVVMQTLKQGEEKLNSCKSNTEKVRIALIMARLQRRLGDKDKSLSLYTLALRTLLDAPDVDMEIRVMHEIGLLLCFEAFDISRGMPYLQGAAEMSLDRAQRDLEEMRSCTRVSPQEKVTLQEGILRIRYLIFALLDTAVCLAENEEIGKSLGLFEQCVSLMDEFGMRKHSAWVRMKYADALANASLVDNSIRVYLETIDTIKSIGYENENLQLACMGMIVPVTVSEVEGRLAYCFQIHVGEYRRACVYFCQAIRRCGVEMKCPFKTAKSKGTKFSEEVDSETLRWMLENYASCCERVGNIEIAEEALEHCVRVEKALGGSCASSLLRLAQLHSATNTMRALELYFQILALPEDSIEPDILLQSAYGFASICYSSRDEELEIALRNAAITLMNKNKTNLSSITTPLDDKDEKNCNTIIIASFKKSASIIMAGHVIDNLRSTTDRDGELKAIMTLSRGGFFCQQRGDDAGAEELYRLAVEYTQAVHVTSDEYARELSILLANYATVMAHKDVKIAQDLYDQAVTICPTEENVSTAAASFFVLTTNYNGGRTCIYRMINATTTNREMLPRLYGKLAWLGVVCWDELTPNLRLECLQHLLLALGIKPENLSLIIIDCCGSTLWDGSVNEDFKRQLLRGIRLSQDEDTVSLAGYVAQTKLHQEGKFINACYKIALTRFPSNTTILVNYAKFCADYDAIDLARKYYAKAFYLSPNDPRTSECYAEFLACLKRRDQERYVIAGEGILRHHLKRSASNLNKPIKAQASALYAKYLASFLPSPNTPTFYFEEAIKLNPADARTIAVYCSFLWNISSRTADEGNLYNMKQNIAKKVELLCKNGLKLHPCSILLLTTLGSLYVELGDRFEDAVKVLERAREHNPRNVTVNRLLCAAFHYEWIKEESKMTAITNTRLQTLVENTRQMYEVAASLENIDRLTLTRYCHFALHGLKDKELAANIAQRLEKRTRK
ncbi:uncharacterized protein TM35_000053740 [Trypanosoma theileri]|uniref:Uncharacterized protein n=1 Tax=Trypanosoma theileri TaxID=67003 RepID=A0A1X0P4L4_9TRYP|nr:uncharacterized protein TM35_000053740 [Trypanosoma theileri]ORC91778.1 hypothetical protein TM35_000053740 [Trypanosoma theileri]